MRNFVLVAAAVMAAGAAAPAFAQSDASQVYVTGAARDEAGHPTSLSRVVKYGDLDLRNPQDQAALRRRVNDAAIGVCNELNLPLPNPTNLGQSCQERASDDAMRQVNVAVTYAMNQPPAVPAMAGRSAETSGANASATVPEAAPAPVTAPTVTPDIVTNGPVPDTPQNRARFGGPMSASGRATPPTGD